jgi:hypothetical protein
MSRLFHARKNMQARLIDLVDGKVVVNDELDVDDAAASGSRS